MPISGNTGLFVGKFYDAGSAIFNVEHPAFAQGGTDDAPAVQRAIDAAVAAGGGTIVIPPRSTGYQWLTPVNATSLKSAQGLHFIGSGGVTGGAPTFITIKHGGVGFDCTGAADIVFENITLIGDQTTSPKAGWLLAREGPVNGSAGRHRFFNCRSRGFFSGGVVWSYGSEENIYYGCFFYNERGGAKTVVLTANNRTDTIPGGLTSSFVTISTGAQSNLLHDFFGGSFMVENGVTSDVFYLEQVMSANFYGIWAFAGNGYAAGPGRSLFYVDGTVATSDLVHINGLHGENVGSGLQQQFGILFGNEAPRTPTGWSLRDARVSVGSTRRTGVPIGTTNGSAAITSAGLFSQADQGGVIIGAGIPNGTRISSVTDASHATMTANATATGSPGAEIVFRLVFAPPNVTLDGFHAEQNPEPDLAGYQFSAPGTSLQASYIKAANSLIVSDVIDRCVFIGNAALWTYSAHLHSVLMDITSGFVDASSGLHVNGTKVVGFQTGGWANQTAVASKANLGAAPTVAQLASWASAIDAMLKAHGLIAT
jgi:hypothetical protein